MKFKLLIIFLLGTLSNLFAQNSGSISGKIIDSNSNPVSYATITVKENNQIITGNLSEDSGIFSIKNLALKNYSIEIQFIGYKTKILSADLSTQKAIHFDKILLEDEATQLESVEIVAERSTIEQKIDRKVINVGRDLTTAGATASEIMNNIPSVNVDQDGKISLRGNQNVRVLIDGRPTNMDPAQLLKQIPSTSIKKIELITNPSAKYNPEGMSGIINIVLNKNANDGFNANLNSGITLGKTPKFNNSLDLNYRVGKVNFFGNVGNNNGEYYNDGTIFRIDNESQQLLDIKNDNKSFLYKIGMDYYINDRNTISFYTNQNNLNGDGIINTRINYLKNDANNLFQNSNYISDNKNATYNLIYRHLFKKDGEKIDFEANLNQYKQTQNAIFDTEIYDLLNPGLLLSQYKYDDTILDERSTTSFNIDYVNPINDKSNLELGAESKLIRSQNEYTTTNNAIPTDNQLSDYTYDIDIHSAYATYGQRFDKFSYQIGTRFESYKAVANLNQGKINFKDEYFTLYPSAYFTYTPNENNMFQLSYSRRVDRPSLEQTKPIREFSTPLTTGIGNPELEPQFTNSFEVNYTKMLANNSSITTSIFYRVINNEINKVFYEDTSTENPNDIIMSWDNFDNNTSYGIEVSSNYKINKWWDIQPAIEFYNINQTGIVAEINDNNNYISKKIEVNSFNARLNSNFKLNSRLSFLLFGFYRGPVDGVQTNSFEMKKIDVGGRYSLLNNQMSISVRFNDVFDQMKARFYTNNPFPSYGQFKWESQTVYIGLNYRFGGGKNKAVQRKYRDDNTKQGGGMF